jgi:hypothetical protein
MIRLKFWPVALSVSALVTVSFILCMVWDLLVPAEWQMYRFWEVLLPGFRYLTLGTFALGVAESFITGLYVAAVFVPLFNFAQKTQAA